MKGNNQVEALGWFLKFMTLDVSGLSDLEFGKLKLEAEYNFSPRIPIMPAAGKFDFGGWHRGAASWWPDKIGGREDWRGVLAGVAAGLRNFLERDFFDGAPGSFGGIPFRIDASFGVADGAGVFVLQPKVPRPLSLDGLMNCAKLNLAFLLSGVPLESIKKCGHCGTYFLNLSAKRKLFCGSKCASRASAKAARERDYESYKEKQRTYMKSRYREKVKVRLGGRVKVGKE